MRRLVLSLVLCLVILAGAGDSTTAAQSDPAHEIIDGVNQLRAARGLPPYRVDAALMAAAQAQTEWRVATGIFSHTGEGGSRPWDRAVAAGYGGGAQVYVSENIVAGTNLTPQQAVQWWQGDWPHLNTMISSTYQDAGAGYAASGTSVHYTLLVGYVAGAPPPQGEVPPASPAPTRVVARPVRVATANPDGSIVHVVERGQAPWTIAVVYGVELPDLLALNNLSPGGLIFPGQELVIRPADTPTPTTTFTPGPPTATASATPPPPPATATASAAPPPPPTETAIPTAAASPTLNPSPTPAQTPAASEPARLVAKGALVAGIALLGFAGALALLGVTLERRRR